MGSSLGCNGNGLKVTEGNFDELVSKHEYDHHLGIILTDLFSCSMYKGINYLCTVYSKEGARSIIIAVSDTRREYFCKEFSYEDLREMRVAVDVNRSIGWYSFFSTLAQCLINKKISIDFTKERNIEEYCNLSFEMSFKTIGRTELTVKLRKTKPNYRLKQAFIYPLFKFFSNNSTPPIMEKIENLEKQIKIFRDKISKMENKKLGSKNASKKHGSPKSPKKSSFAKHRMGGRGRTDSETESDTNIDQIPKVNSTSSMKEVLIDDGDGDSLFQLVNTTKIYKFLKDMKEKLVTKSALSESDSKSFNEVLKVIDSSRQSVIGGGTHTFTQSAPASGGGPTENSGKDRAMRDVIEEVTKKFQKEGEPGRELRGRIREEEEAEEEEEGVSERSVSGDDLAGVDGRGLKKKLKKVDDFLEHSKIKKSKIKDDIVKMFDRVDEWNFDVFTLDELTGGETLFVTSYTLFVKHRLLEKFKIHEKTLINLLKEIQSSYHPNPYHNAMHAADVTQVLHYIIHKGKLNKHLTDEDIIAALLSAIIHDLDHPGMNNSFQVNSSSYLAILYNDRSVLENHHTAQAFELFKSKKCNIFANVEESKYNDIRATIIEMVLATDMAVHSTIFGKFRHKLENENPTFTNKDDVLLALQIAIKMADVSNPSRPTYLYLQWASRLCEELYNQGDKERSLGIEISPLMDRRNPALQKGQIAFMNYIILPMFEAFTYLLSKMNFCIKYIHRNKDYWATHTEIDYDFIKLEKKKDLLKKKSKSKSKGKKKRSGGEGRRRKRKTHREYRIDGGGQYRHHKEYNSRKERREHKRKDRDDGGAKL